MPRAQRYEEARCRRGEPVREPQELPRSVPAAVLRPPLFREPSPEAFFPPGVLGVLMENHAFPLFS